MSNNLKSFIWPAEFSCTIITENIVVPNYYAIKISIVPYDTGKFDIATGFKKIRHFVDHYLHNSIIINETNKLLLSFSDIETNLVLLPTEPYDYFLGSILYCKFSSISQSYFAIDQLSIDSIIGDRIQYNIRDPLECGLNLEGNFWWNMSTETTDIDNLSAQDDSRSPKFEPRVIQGGLSED
jgi:hypothetical protein